MVDNLPQLVRKTERNHSDRILDKIDQITRLLFHPPPAILKKWNCTLTTGGVTANWHCVKRTKENKTKKSHQNRVLVSVGFSKANLKNVNLITVETGHVDLIAAARGPLQKQIADQPNE